MFERRRNWPEALLFVLAAILLFTGLGSHSVHNADEARYWIVIDEMMEAGRFDDFTLRGEPYFNKAPLRIGMSHLLALGFGLDPWTLRLPSALMGLAGLALVLAIGRRSYGIAASRWAGLVFLTSTQFLYIHGGRSGEMDSTLLAFWWGALLAAMLARERPKALWWCAVLVGLAGLVKHVAYIAPVGATVLLWLFLTGDFRTIGWRRILGAGVLAVAVVLPWHLFQIARHGMDFVDGYLGREVVERVAEDYQGGYGWAFYVSVIKDGMFAWSLLLPFAVWDGFRRARREAVTGFLLVLAGFMVAGLMLAQGDLSWYVMPVLPALALLVGRWIPTSGKWVWLAIAVVFALSPSNVMIWDVHQRFAIEGLIGGDVLGIVQGHEAWWPQVAVGGMMLLGLALWHFGRAKTGREITLVAFAGFAVVHAALPLRTAFHRSDVDRFSVRLEQVVDGPLVTVLPKYKMSSSVQYAHLERAAGEVVFVTSIEDRQPDRWCAVREEDLAGFELPPGALREGIWIAIPPDPR